MWFVQLAPGYRLDVDVGFMLAGLPTVLGQQLDPLLQQVDEVIGQDPRSNAASLSV
jgi:hypothetical protein